MPRYHFNVFDGSDLPDPDGAELPDAKSAQLVAIEYAGQLIADHAKRLEPGEDWHMEVTDASGLTLFRLDFSITRPGAVGLSARS